MNETESSETKPKKMVSRNVAVALGISCFIVIAGMAGAFAYYVSTHTHTNSEIDALVSDLFNIVNLYHSKSTIWNNQTISQPAGSYFTFQRRLPPYAGYIAVNVQSSTNNTYVHVIYSTYGVNFDRQISVGTDGIAIFPILPPSLGYTSPIEVRVGNTNSVNGATETVKITYYY